MGMAAALQARLGGLGWRWWPWGRRGGAERPLIGELRRWRCKRGRRAGWDSTGGSPVALCGGRRRCTASTTVGGVARACEDGSVRLRASGLSRSSVRRALRARARAGARAGRAACVGAAGGGPSEDSSGDDELRGARASARRAAAGWARAGRRTGPGQACCVAGAWSTDGVSGRRARPGEQGAEGAGSSAGAFPRAAVRAIAP